VPEKRKRLVKNDHFEDFLGMVGNEGELDESATCKDLLQVKPKENRQLSSNTCQFDLENGSCKEMLYNCHQQEMTKHQ
jgi:hypothetical protein